MANVVSVLTQETAEAIIEAGGTEPWTLDRKRASSGDFLMCCHKAGSLMPGDEKVGAAFLIGKIKDVVPSETSEGRWKITISEYETVQWPDQWNAKKKNPVAYWNTEEFPDKDGDPDFLKKLDFKPINQAQVSADTSAQPMSVAQAKAGLAKTFGVDESAIEITIRV